MDPQPAVKFLENYFFWVEWCLWKVYLLTVLLGKSRLYITDFKRGKKAKIANAAPLNSNPPLKFELSELSQAFETTNFRFVVMKSGFQLVVFAAAITRNTNLAENMERPATVVIALTLWIFCNSVLIFSVAIRCAKILLY